MAFTAPAPEGPWSEPIDIGLGGIDPGHVVDKDGTRYLFTGSGEITQLSDDGLSIIGETRKVYDGWQFPDEWVVEGFFLESPKLTYHNGYYYITVAQGGTGGPATSHMVASARSSSLFGPYENSPYNPIIRTQSRSERWWSRGHGTLVDTPNGDWWIIYHSYEKGFQTLGRQTLLEPLEWTEDGWFRVPEGISPEQPIKKPAGEALPHGLTLSDDFASGSLGMQWSFFKEHNRERYNLSNGALELQASATRSPLVSMPEDHSYEATVEVTIEESSEARLLIFYHENSFSGIAFSNEGFSGVLKGWKTPGNGWNGGNTVHLRMRNLEHEVVFYYSTDGTNWTKLQHSVEASGYHHNVLGGFLALRIGLDALGEGKVTFKNFQYRAL